MGKNTIAKLLLGSYLDMRVKLKECNAQVESLEKELIYYINTSNLSETERVRYELNFAHEDERLCACIVSTFDKVVKEVYKGDTYYLNLICHTLIDYKIIKVDDFEKELSELQRIIYNYVYSFNEMI